MKYEEQLKDKLEQRTIQPSSDAWQKLNDKLDANKSKKNNKGFWYLGIAASIVGILLITNVFNNDNTNATEPTIVDTDKTNLESEVNYYNKIRKIGLIHTAGSTLTSLISLTSVGLGLSTISIFIAPVSLTYWGYHVYMTQKSVPWVIAWKMLLF